MHHVFPRQLSLGMARRVALARAFAVHPTLLLMDEPFVSPDEPTAQRLRRLLLEVLRHHPATVLFVTHTPARGDHARRPDHTVRAAPGHVIAEVPVPLSPERRLDEAEIERFRRTLHGREDLHRILAL